MKKLLAALVVVLVAGVSYWAWSCPCDQTPGLFLRGTQASEKVTNWAFANQVPLCQVEVDTGLLTRALNLNCWSDTKGDLYLSCGNCEGKGWATAAVANPEARVRVGETVYPVRLTRILGDDALNGVWQSRGVKLPNANDPKPAGWGVFRVASR